MADSEPESSSKGKNTKLHDEVKRLEVENMRLKLKLKRAEGLLDLQKKAFELLGEMDQDDTKSGKS